MKIMSVVGARPNFMKIAPFVHAIAEHNALLVRDGLTPGEHVLVHTGQHYDERMSATFFRELDIPNPDIDLEIGSGSHAEQVGRTMMAFEKVVREHKPDWVVVVGDVNATCACAITAKKEQTRLAHIEAGLRSFDMTMPEEVNRLVTDRLADLLLTPDEFSSENLRHEGVPEERIRLVGNIMIDTLESHRDRAAKLDLASIVRENLLASTRAGRVPTLEENGYLLVTLHRPSNVDHAHVLGPIADLLCKVAADMPLLWSIHPRARKQLVEFGLWDKVNALEPLILVRPLGYDEMLRLNMSARTVLTDSGGLQEECCVLGTPCLTLRWNTERPVTLREHGGLSVLVGNAPDEIRRAYRQSLHNSRTPYRPPMWDGQTAPRVVTAILEA